jgi:hypothetical protein
MCRCGSYTCHVCNMPLPVDRRHLRLVLELVCLTCQECGPWATQAHFLLTLLLQRAEPEDRAAFLNSADGVRLLVALQQRSATEEDNRGAGATYMYYRHIGALLLPEEGGWQGDTWALPFCGLAACCLAWSFCEARLGAAATAAGSPSSSSGADAAQPWLTAAAVARGCILGVGGVPWQSEWVRGGMWDPSPCQC